MKNNEWINSKDRIPKFGSIIDRHGYKYRETGFVLGKITFNNKRTIHVNISFTKSVSRPKEGIKVYYQHFIGGKHPEDFSGYSQINIPMEHIENIDWLDEQ